MAGATRIWSTMRDLGHPAEGWQTNGLLIFTGPVAELSVRVEITIVIWMSGMIITQVAFSCFCHSKYSDFKNT